MHSGLQAQVIPPPGFSRPSLLTLPPELIDLILMEVLGGQVFHVNFSVFVRREHLSACQSAASCLVNHGPILKLRTCDARMSELRAFQQFRAQTSGVPADDDGGRYVEDSHHRHLPCRPWENPAFPCTDPEAVSPQRNVLGIMRVCRQLAPRAFETFWATNAFFFEQPGCLNHFLMQRNNKEVQLIKHIYMNINKHWGRYDFNPLQIRRLVSLDHLHLSIHTSLVGRSNNDGSTEQNLDKIHVRRRCDGTYLHFEVLNIKRVTVIVYDNQENSQRSWSMHPNHQFSGPSSSPFTPVLKRELAEEIEKILLAKEETRNVFAAKDRQIFLVKELLMALEYSQDIRGQLQRNELRNIPSPSQG